MKILFWDVFHESDSKETKIDVSIPNLSSIYVKQYGNFVLAAYK